MMKWFYRHRTHHGLLIHWRLIRHHIWRYHCFFLHNWHLSRHLSRHLNWHWIRISFHWFNLQLRTPPLNYELDKTDFPSLQHNSLHARIYNHYLDSYKSSAPGLGPQGDFLGINSLWEFILLEHGIYPVLYKIDKHPIIWMNSTSILNKWTKCTNKQRNAPIQNWTSAHLFIKRVGCFVSHSQSSF